MSSRTSGHDNQRSCPKVLNTIAVSTPLADYLRTRSLVEQSLDQITQHTPSIVAAN